MNERFIPIHCPGLQARVEMSDDQAGFSPIFNSGFWLKPDFITFPLIPGLKARGLSITGKSAAE